MPAIHTEGRRGAVEASRSPGRVNDAAITFDGLTVRRGGTAVLHGIAGAIPAGQVTGLFGPSGSGKSTLIRAMVGVQRGVSGTIRVLGHDAGDPAVRHQLGYMPQSPSVYEDLTVDENLRYFASLRDAQVGDVRDRVDLERQAHQLVRDLSGGQRARVSLAAALVGSPRLLVLDEPTVGLDPLLRRDLWALFRALAGEGATLLISSHVLDEARHCDQIILLREGRLLAQLTPAELTARTGQRDLDDAFVALIERS